MRTLVVGSGAREHALCWTLAKDGEVMCAPGNPGIAEDAEIENVASDDDASICDLALRWGAELVVVGPENPLIAGLAGNLRLAGLRVYGPDGTAAKLEGSKSYAKEIMAKAGVPTASSQAFTSSEAAIGHLRASYGVERKAVVKASGAAFGKGVVVAETLDEAEHAVRRMIIDREFGDSGSTVVIEERLEGFEFSLLTLVSDTDYWSLPVAQDYKRIGTGDTGPNTGGMGSFSPCSRVSADLVQQVEETMVKPIVDLLLDRGITFRGTLFTGVMVTPDGPKCLEYNVRFGDPEIQSLVRLIDSGFGNALAQAAEGDPIDPPSILNLASTTVVVASAGYPGPYKTGIPIEVGAMPSGVKLFHAATARSDGQLTTAGGRVMAVSAIGATVCEARDAAYRGVNAVKFEGMVYRDDIALNA